MTISYVTVIMGAEREPRQAVSPIKGLWNHKGNRHLPGWRFPRFTMIVTVKAPICSVIRIASPPFRERGQPPAVARLPLCAPNHTTVFDKMQQKSAVRQAVERRIPMIAAARIPDAAPVPRLAAAYIRVSTDDQIELSPASQLVEIRGWASAHGYIVPDEFVYRDEGITGRKVVGRDAFRRMIGMAKTKPKPFDAILLWKFSRFARNRDDAVMYKSILRKQLGIDVISVSEPMADGKMGIITEALIEAMDEYYSINLAEEVKRGMEEKHRRGELQSTPAYGYSVSGNVLVPKEPEASHVKELFRRFVSGEGTYPLARWLNDIGARTHRGNRFENRTIEYILRNPVYIGKLRWNPKGKTRRDFDSPDVVLADGKHEPLISVETYEAAQKRMAEIKATWKYRGKPAAVQKDWISGLVRCSSCGATLIFSKPHFWKCNNYVRGRCGVTQHISDELLKAAVIQGLRRDAAGDALSFTVCRAPDGGDAELAALRAARSSARKRIERLRDAYLSGADTVEEYRTAKQVLQEQIFSLDDQIAAFEEKSRRLGTPDKLKTAIYSVLEVLASDSATIEQKYTAVHSIIDHAVWNKAENTLQIHYHLVI